MKKKLLSGITPMSPAELEAIATAIGNLLQPQATRQEIRDASRAAMAAFYRQRFGPAPGSSAVHEDGRVAVRFYDTVEKRYRWQISPSPEADGVAQIRVSDAPFEGAETTGWTHHEASWLAFVG